MSGMTDARALAEIDGYVPRHCRAAIEHIAARLRGEAAPENVAEDSYHFMADLLAPHVTDTHGGLPGSVVESFQMLLEHWKRTHTAQGKQQAVAWVSPEQLEALRRGHDSVSASPHKWRTGRQTVPLYTRPMPAAPRPITPGATPVAQWPKNGGHEL